MVLLQQSKVVLAFFTNVETLCTLTPIHYLKISIIAITQYVFASQPVRVYQQQAPTLPMAV